MQLPPPDPNTLFEQFVQDLPDEYEQMARDFKAFSRARKIRHPRDLLRVTMLYCGVDQTLREVAATTTLLVEKITDSSIAERLAGCQPWIRAMLSHMLGQPDLCDRLKGRRLKVFDGSSIQGPGAKGTQYRLHLGIDLLTLELTDLLLTDKHTGESLLHFELSKGDIALVDRGYCYQVPILETVKKGADVIARLNRSVLRLEDPQERPLQLVDELQKHEHKRIHTFPVLLAGSKSPEKAAGWIHAYQLPEDKANQAKRRYRRKKQKKGETASQESVYLCGWVVVFTTLSPELLDGETTLSLYRARWQIELIFKRFKSLMRLDRLRARMGSALAEVWLHGKMLYILIVDKKIRRKCWDEWAWLDRERKVTWWRAYKMMMTQVEAMITGSLYWDQAAWTAAIEVLAERPRKRRLQTIPPEVLAFRQQQAAHQQTLRKAA